jgi:3-hydroxybutyryl-CoA dehydrogenase
MGAGIAQVLAVAGHRVVIAESNGPAALAALDRVAAGLERAVEHGALVDPEEIIERVQAVDSVGQLPTEATLVIEAIPEDLVLKRDVLAKIEELVSADCLIATNTSSLSIEGLAAALKEPGRFLGMHFFNPVPASALVEIVTAQATTHETLTHAVALAALVGKESIVVRDSPGFATSRLGVLLGLEAIRMLEEGVADAAAIDRAMELGYRHPMGPLRSTDLVGLDVRLAIAEHLQTELGDRFAPPALLREKVARGEVGRKSGRGFYVWDA